MWFCNVVNEGRCQKEACFSTKQTSCNKNTIETEYIIYPNPTKDVVHLLADTNWELLTLTGITLEQNNQKLVKQELRS